MYVCMNNTTVTTVSASDLAGISDLTAQLVQCVLFCSSVRLSFN